MFEIKLFLSLLINKISYVFWIYREYYKIRYDILYHHIYIYTLISNIDVHS